MADERRDALIYIYMYARVSAHWLCFFLVTSSPEHGGAGDGAATGRGWARTRADLVFFFLMKTLAPRRRGQMGRG